MIWPKKGYISLSVNSGALFQVYYYFIIKLINILYNLLKILKIVMKSILNLFLMRSPFQINRFRSNQVFFFFLDQLQPSVKTQYKYILTTNLRMKKKNFNQNLYSFRPTLFVLFEKSNFLREHHLLSCLPFKNVQVSKTTLK